ncbi:MAG: DUF58 domain-containing protein [Pirellulaceae bacterium]|nr:DUF58 domain-containing protein [Pirellulaceae bacterium]
MKEQKLERSAAIDPATLMRIKNLQLRAKHVVDGFHNGLHRSPLHGFSVEFSEYRPFVSGDDPRSIDWKLFARSDRYYLKKYEDETNRRCHLIVDQSRSMGFGSLEYSKLEYARTLAATLAYYLILQRDAVGMMTFESDVTAVVPARYRSGQLRRLLMLLDQSPQGTATDLQKPLSHLADIVKQRGLMLIISDFLVPVASLQQPLSYLAARRHEVILIRLLDPAEVSLGIQQPTVVRDMESGREMYIDPKTAANAYQTKFQSHADDLKSLTGKLGMTLVTMRTDEPLELALWELLHARERRTSRGRANQRGAGKVADRT